MKSLLTTALTATAILIGFNVQASEELDSTSATATKLDQVHDFLKLNAINRTLSLTEKGNLDNQNIAYEFKET